MPSDRTGELTRGMLVIDRRQDESAGPIKSEAQKDPYFVPSSVLDSPAVFCITHTPGPPALLRLLLNRVWGCKQQ